MTNTIAPPTLEELNERIAAVEDLRDAWQGLPSKALFDIELYCLYAVRDGVTEEIKNIRGALATIYNSTEPDAIKHKSYDHLASNICAVVKAALDGQFVDDMHAAEVYDYARSPWMDIETAPKDGLIDIWTEGFGADPHRIASCYYDQICGEWRTSRPTGQLLCIKERYVTHWMPIPAPPTRNSPKLGSTK